MKIIFSGVISLFGRTGLPRRTAADGSLLGTDSHHQVHAGLLADHEWLRKNARKLRQENGLTRPGGKMGIKKGTLPTRPCQEPLGTSFL